MSAKLTPELVSLVNRLTDSIEKIKPPTRGGGYNTTTALIVKSLYGVITKARLSKVTLKSIAEDLRANGVKITAPTLKKHIAKIEAEMDEKAKEMAQAVMARKPFTRGVEE